MRSARCNLGLSGDQTKMFSRVQHTPRQGGVCCLSAPRKKALFCRKFNVCRDSRALCWALIEHLTF